MTQPSSLMDELLHETLDRIRGGNIDSGWWQSLLAQFGQQYVSPDFLRKPSIQEWLAETPVANDLKAIAAWRVMATAEDEAAPRDRLAQSYSNHTLEALYLAAGPVDVVVAILVAGYIGAIHADQRAIAGIVQAGFSHTDDRLDLLTKSVSSLINPIARQDHTKRTEREIARILTLRSFDPAKSRSEIQKLQGRLAEGDLVAADERTKGTVRYWLARLHAGDAATLDVAREFRAQVSANDPAKDLTIVDALIVELEGDPKRAIRILRDHDDPDSRTTVFALLVRSRGANTALEMYADAIDGADVRYLTAVGWKIWAGCMAESGRWQEAAQRLAEFDGTWSEAPALALVEGIINAQLLLPEERRSLTYNTHLYLGITPNQGEQAEVAHKRATACIEIAQSGLQDIEGTGLERTVSDWSRWLRLMNPKEDNEQDAHVEIRNDLESDHPDVTLIVFAWAFGVSFNPEPLRRYLAGRAKLGGLNEDEIRAECLLSWTAMNSNEISNREFFAYLETNQTRIAGTMPANLLMAMRVDALLRDDQAERARACFWKWPMTSMK